MERDRRSYLGSGDVAIILGYNPYETTWDLWNFKKNGIKREFTDEQLERMEWGNLIEPVLIKKVCDERKLQMLGSQVHFKHQKYEFIGGTADEITNSHLIEAKTSHEFNKSYTDEVPIMYYIQANHLMGLSNIQNCLFPVLFGGQKHKIYEIEFDYDFYNTCINKCVEFWEKYVIGNEEPEKFSNQIEVKKEGKITADVVVMNTYKSLKKLKIKIKTLEEQKRFYENLIKDNMKENEYLCDENWKDIATWKEYESEKFDYNKAKKLLGDKAKDCIQISKTRKFLLKDMKEE